MATSGERTQVVERPVTCTKDVVLFGFDVRCLWSGLADIYIETDDWAHFECRNGHTTEFKWEG